MISQKQAKVGVYLTLLDIVLVMLTPFWIALAIWGLCGGFKGRSKSITSQVLI